MDADTRAQVDAHLTGCAECRRELDRLRATVSLLHAVERPQAPAGFADRVLEAARPVPWYRGFLDRLAAVRLLRFPVEAAAVVLVASLAVYVFQQTPALKQAASPETSADRVARGSASSTETGGRVPVIAPMGGQDVGPEETDAPARYRTPPSAPPPAAPVQGSRLSIRVGLDGTAGQGAGDGGTRSHSPPGRTASEP